MSTAYSVIPHVIQFRVHVCECGYATVDSADVEKHENTTGHEMMTSQPTTWVSDEYHIDELTKAATSSVTIDRSTNTTTIQLVLPRSLLNEETADAIRPKLKEMGIQNPYDIMNKIFPELFANPATDLIPNKQNTQCIL